MTDSIPTPEKTPEVAPVVEIKTRQKPGPKPKAPAARVVPQDSPVGLPDILVDIEVEIERQREKWGVQDHPLVGGIKPENAAAYYASQEIGWKAINDKRVIDSVIGWDGILIEETFEALAAETRAEQEAELIQVAAVAVNAILSLRRQAL